MSQISEPRRERRPRNSLTVEAILDAAERVVGGGPDALTVRAVAVELGASPMALYRYFETKDELIDALLNRVLGRIAPAVETGDLFDDLGAFARRHRELLMAHPWAIAELIARPYPGPNAVPIGEDALRILARAGIAGELSVAIFSGIIALNYGWASFAAARTGGNDREVVERIDAPMPANTPFPLTASVAGAMRQYGSDAHYEAVLTRFLTGVVALAPG